MFVGMWLLSGEIALLHLTLIRCAVVGGSGLCMALLVCFRSGPTGKHLQLVKSRLQLYLYLIMGRMLVYMLGSPTHPGRLEQHFFNRSRVESRRVHI